MAIEFIQSQTKKWVPVVNDVLLHSSVDPEREAKAFIDREWDRVEAVKSVIVLGLGGGFHIHELLSRKDFRVLVIEAEKEVLVGLQERDMDQLSKFEVLAGVTPGTLYKEQSLQECMSQSYAIIRHAASQRISTYYYQSVVQVLNDRTLSRVRQLVDKNTELLQFFDSLDIAQDQILTPPLVEEAMIRRGMGLEKQGLIWMAIRELIV